MLFYYSILYYNYNIRYIYNIGIIWYSACCTCCIGSELGDLWLKYTASGYWALAVRDVELEWSQPLAAWEVGQLPTGAETGRNRHEMQVKGQFLEVLHPCRTGFSAKISLFFSMFWRTSRCFWGHRCSSAPGHRVLTTPQLVSRPSPRRLLPRRPRLRPAGAYGPEAARPILCYIIFYYIYYMVLYL